ncbi:hypothetical protein J437_LFUL016535 [Ladona fulva]|uniref:Uncharacterized protein n=1 Tax=Ladona fulva TaxID=123851 RepID=A0A8K0KKK0_LADFU|nr:hypothetical protein J437_LFUL016535 [Ladona fulva]
MIVNFFQPCCPRDARKWRAARPGCSQVAACPLCVHCLYDALPLTLQRSQVFRSDIPRLATEPNGFDNEENIALLRGSGLPTETCKNLLPQAPVPPRLYGLSKTHKKGTLLRPIVSAINSPTYLLARYLSKLLTPHVGNSIHHVKNSAEFVRTLSQLRLDPGDIMPRLKYILVMLNYVPSKRPS